MSHSLEWHGAPSVAALIDTATRGLRELIPCEAVGWNELDLLRGTAVVVTNPADALSVPLQRFAQLVEEHPIVEHIARTGDGSTRTISEVVSTRDLHRRAFYQEVLRPIGVEDQLATVITGPPVVLGVAFNRRRRDFTQRDRELLDLLKPHLAAAYARARALERLDAADRGLSERGEGVVTLGPSGELDVALGAARMLLRRCFGEVPARIVPGTYASDEAVLEVTRVEGDPPLLLLAERPLHPDPRRVRALGLTRREGEILALARRGLQNAEIADTLVISSRTVQKHLEHAYDKLGVRDRHRAAALLFER